MEPDVLVVDIGTGAAKIECFDSEGTVIERAVAEYVGVDPQRDTIDPEVWYSAVVKAVQQLSEKASLATLVTGGRLSPPFSISAIEQVRRLRRG